MKLIICGGRDYRLTKYDWRILNGLHLLLKFTEIVSGGCSGVDKDGESWAEANKIPVKQFLPNWDDEGRAAGPIRNQQMADYADACICFPGGRGTLDMKRKAFHKGLKVWQVGLKDVERSDLL